ncbi:hypothetical protein ACHQM5_030327 [Ranunculus cassubicifolius]
MATTARDTTSYVKEKTTTKSPSSTNHKNDPPTQGKKPSKPFVPSSTVSKGLAVVTDKPSPHYLKPTASSIKDPSCQYGKKHASDDTSIKTSQSRRKSIDKAPSPAQLKRTLSSGPSERRRLTSPSPPLKKVSPKRERSTSAKTPTISPKRVTERSVIAKTPTERSVSAKTPTMTSKTVTKPAILKKSATTLTPTRPKKVSKPSTSKSATATPTSPNPDSTIETLLVNDEEENKADPVEEVAEVSIEVVPEQTTPLEDSVEIDETPTMHEETELQNSEEPEPEEEVLKSSIEEEVPQNEVLPKEEEIQHNTIEDNVEHPEESQPEPEAIAEETREPEANAEEDKESEANADEENKDEPVKEKTTSPKTLGAEEAQTPRKLNFQPAKRLEMKESQDEPNLRLKFKERKDDRGDEEEKAESENVVLKRQDVQGKKESPAYNDVIEETASKLVGKRKSKVKALVGAFETVINLENDTQQTEE